MERPNKAVEDQAIDCHAVAQKGGVQKPVAESWFQAVLLLGLISYHHHKLIDANCDTKRENQRPDNPFYNPKIVGLVKLLHRKTSHVPPILQSLSC